jgi:hypothetical protein
MFGTTSIAWRLEHGERRQRPARPGPLGDVRRQKPPLTRRRVGEPLDVEGPSPRRAGFDTPSSVRGHPPSIGSDARPLNASGRRPSHRVSGYGSAGRVLETHTEGDRLVGGLAFADCSMRGDARRRYGRGPRSQSFRAAGCAGDRGHGRAAAAQRQPCEPHRHRVSASDRGPALMPLSLCAR